MVQMPAQEGMNEPATMTVRYDVFVNTLFKYQTPQVM